MYFGNIGSKVSKGMSTKLDLNKLNTHRLSAELNKSAKTWLFKLADRMRSMQTNGASKTEITVIQNGGDFPHGQI